VYPVLGGVQAGASILSPNYMPTQPLSFGAVYQQQQQQQQQFGAYGRF